MLKLAICDDDIQELQNTDKLCRAYCQAHPEVDISLNSFSSPTEMKARMTKGETYDVYLLDIYMPEAMGTDLARWIRETNPDCQIIFLTTSTTHAIEAFSLHAAHYLVKPYDSSQLEDALNKALIAFEKKAKAQLTIKCSDGICRISFSDFIYAETNMHTQLIYLANGQCHTVRMKSTELFERLSFDSRFFKCGSTYIINLDKVNEITKNHILFETKIKIPMQRRRFKDLVDRYTAYALEGSR